MSFLTPQIELDQKDAERLRKLRYYVGNPEKGTRGHLYDFCVDVLGYDALSPTFHKPMLEDWDRTDLRRFRIYLGLEEKGETPIDNLDLWFRGAIKTWCTRARILRYYLFDPQITVVWWHAVEDEAVASGESISDQLLQNKELRSLFPAGILPAQNRKKFFTGGSFRLKGQRVGDAPSLVCMGAGGEGTGKHAVVGVLDDFIGWNDVVDGQMQKKKDFFRATVCNVILRTKDKVGWLDAIGTHWALDDPYMEWRDSQDWISRVRACLETDGKPDPAGEPVYLTREQIEKERRRQGTLFSFQMMNDPSPPGLKPWIPDECEHTCTIEEAKGQGHVVALCDPAPRALGAIGWEGKAALKSGSKNFWANVIVKLRRKGELQQIILLDGEQSKDWGLDEGMDRLVKLALKWRAVEGYAESTSTPIYLEKFQRAKKELGWRGYAIGSRRTVDSSDRLRSTYNANAKISYIAELADRAKSAEVVVCDSFPLKDEFFRCMRGFMPLPDGRTGIPFDDLINAVAFATDPYFRGRYQAVDEEWAQSPFKRRDEEQLTGGSRYVQW